SWRSVINAYRMPLNEDCWLDINGVPAGYGGAKYQNEMSRYITLLHQAGIYVILDLQWNAPGRNLAHNIADMADADHALTFWTSVANYFKNDPAVIFDLFNEPHNISDACWRDGCSATDDPNNPSYVPYNVVGMQTLINTVRATGATQPIMVSANGWGNSLAGYMSFKPSDPLNSLVAS